YVDDIQLPGMLYMAVLRSPHPHARIVSIDASAAREAAGVEIVITGDDLDESLSIKAPIMAPGMKVPSHPVLARGVVHAVGVPIAAVVAASRALAQDAVDLIQVEYDPLPSIANAEAALESGAPLAREELNSNVCYTLTKEGGNVEAAFAKADHISRMHIASPRQVAMALEPRG